MNSCKFNVGTLCGGRTSIRGFVFSVKNVGKLGGVNIFWDCFQLKTRVCLVKNPYCSWFSAAISDISQSPETPEEPDLAFVGTYTYMYIDNIYILGEKKNLTE